MLPSCSIQGVFLYSLDKLRSVPAGKGSTQFHCGIEAHTHSQMLADPMTLSAHSASCLADSLAHNTQSHIQELSSSKNASAREVDIRMYIYM